MSLLFVLYISLLLACLAPILHRQLGAKSGWVLSLWPLGLTLFFVSLLPAVVAGDTIRAHQAWVPGLGLGLDLSVDGLSLLFALLICGVGTLIVIYAGGYLKGHERLGQFYAFLLLFMMAMLGLVLSDNLLGLFVFWELTSIISYLLIGFEHQRDAARKGALQAFLITGAGGLVLLVGVLMLGMIGNTYTISELFDARHTILAHPLYEVTLALILIGAFTKSAQFPFHFWLPNAMQAPTPASAYLHAATMVKAGVFLLARLYPALGGTDAWHYGVAIPGAITMLLGAVLAIPQTDLKRLLAFSTVSALGTSVLLLGLGTASATKAAMVFLLVHSLYKGALFMVAGIIDHEAGTRDVRDLGGLRRWMPITAIAAALAGLSMAGLPPLFGFVAKELVYEAKTQAPQAAWLITGAGMTANALFVAVAVTAGIRPFWGRVTERVKVSHEAPLNLWFAPLVLAVLGVVMGLLPDVLAGGLIEVAVGAVRAEQTEIKLKLWHGINPILGLSILTLIAGGVVYALRNTWIGFAHHLKPLALWGPERMYDGALKGLNAVAVGHTRLLQNGYLRWYLLVIFLTTVLLLGGAFMVSTDIQLKWTWPDGQVYETMVVGVIFLASLATVMASSRLMAVAALGVVGYGVAVLFALYGAPDLAMTQFVIETLSVILFVLVLYRLPQFERFSSRATRIRDAGVALAVGALMTGLVLLASSMTHPRPVSNYFSENSVPMGHGRNIVNVILVDFRALDTLGEIAVLAIAAIGVYALLKGRSDKDEKQVSD